MPLYEYNCADCGPFEARRAIEDRSTAPCPSCGSLGLKHISNPTMMSITGAHYRAAERAGALVVGDDDARRMGFEKSDERRFAPDARHEAISKEADRRGVEHKPPKELAHAIRMGEDLSCPI